MISQAIKALLAADYTKIKNYDDFSELKRQIAKKYKVGMILSSDILKVVQKMLSDKNISEAIRTNLLLATRILRKRSIRTLSGIAPVAVLTKPYPCPGSCAYCPKETNVPTSYLSNEPAVMRAIGCNYDPYKQIVSRLAALESNGHEPNKIEVIVIGGTWSYLPSNYKYWYILNCFKAINDFSKLKKAGLKNQSTDVLSVKKFLKTLKSPYKQNLSLIKLKNLLNQEQKTNEQAPYSLIGLTLETRPDYINDKELKEMRDLGATRVEIGVQALDDKILKLNQRGHDVATVAIATKLLRDYGFKITYHLMPALPGATPKKDLEIFKKLFNNENFQPDQIKFYPTVVTKGSLLYKWWQQKKYKPYTDKQLAKLIADCKAVVPEYVRIIRLIRDIPGESIVAGNKITNLRQVLQQQGVMCRCIRCREAKNQPIKNEKLSIIKYQANGGTEYFINFESQDKKTLFGFCRLRISKDSLIAPALIRELHVYGELVPIGGLKKVQHSGLGKKLMLAAEKIARQHKCPQIAVISGIGVRNYYKKLGYRKVGTYMIKSL